jgi:hypothetical protein
MSYHTSTGITSATIVKLGLCPLCLGTKTVVITLPASHGIPAMPFVVACHACTEGNDNA